MASATKKKATKAKAVPAQTIPSVDTPIALDVPAMEAAGAKCGQCGRELRHVPFMLKNIMCRDCYGLDRYRRATPITNAALHTTPPAAIAEPAREIVLGETESAAALAAS